MDKKKQKVYLISNAHIDPIWQWEFDEGVAAALSTFRNAAALAEENGFVFCHNEAILYEWIEHNEPSLFKKICELVKKGRWKIMGGWYLQPDCNMISGESFIRQIETGRRYFQEKFGAAPTVAVNVDSFGHSRGMVQILAKCGYQGYIVGRPASWDFHPEASGFEWVGLDDSTVKVARLPFYNTLLGRAAKRIDDAAREDSRDKKLIFWGVGNHGGGPSRKDIRDIERLREESEQFEYVHSCPEDFFAEMKERLPKIADSMHPSVPACYISQSRVKRMHRCLENLLDFTEKLTACVAANGFDSRSADTALAAAGKDLMLSQFHDVLPGTSIERSEKEALMFLAHGVTELKRLRTQMMCRLSAGEKLPPQSYAFLVFNPNPYEISCPVQCEFMLADQNHENYFTDIRIFCGESEVPAQIVKEDSNIPLDWRKRVAFTAKLKPMGITAFYGVENRVEKKPFRGYGLPDGIKFQNKDYSAAIDGNGFLNRLVRKDKEFLTGRIGFAVFKDDEDTWGIRGQKLVRIGERAGEYRPATLQESTALSGTLSDIAPVRMVENGNVLTAIESMFVYNRSHLLATYTFYRDLEYIDLHIRILQQNKDELLKLEIPVGEGAYLGEIPFGYETLKEGGCENVSLRWTGIFSDKGAFAVLNDGVYGSSYENGNLYISLTRSSAYTGHPLGDAPVLSDDRYFPRVDQGVLEFHFRFVFATDAEGLLRRVTALAQEFNEQPYALHMMPDGRGQRGRSSLIVDDPAIVVTAFRKCEKGFSARLLNNSEIAAKTKVTFMDSDPAELSFGAFEAKTLHISEIGKIEEKSMFL